MEHKTIKLEDILETSFSGVWGDAPDTSDVNVEVIKVSDVSKDRQIVLPKLTARSVSLRVAEKCAVREGDIVVVKSSGSSTNILSGRAAYIHKELVGKNIIPSNFVFVLRPNAALVHARYLWHFLDTPAAIEFVRSIVGGSTYPNIKVAQYLTMPIVIPVTTDGKSDLIAQKRISDELDAMIELKRNAEADAAKTQSLFGSVSVRQFKQVGEGREVKLEEICEVTKGKSPTLKTKPGEYPLVVTAAERKSADNYQFDDEAVCIPLVSSTGHGHASLHRIHYQDGKFALANIMVALTAKDKDEVSMKYLYYYLLHYRNELFVPLMRGVANVTIPLGSIGQVEVRLPDIEDQKRVVALFDEVEQLKSQLQHRNTLMSQLVRSVMNETFAMQT